MPAIHAGAVSREVLFYSCGLGTNKVLPSNFSVVCFLIRCCCTGISASEIGNLLGGAGDSDVINDDEGMPLSLSCMSGSYGWT